MAFSGELALAQGTVRHISQNSISLNLDKEIHNKNTRFVIDKFEYTSQNSGNWLNLARLMSNSDPAKRLRNVIIGKKSASFVSGLPKEVALVGKNILKPLNRVQQKAVFKTLMADQFVLLKGIFYECLLKCKHARMEFVPQVCLVVARQP